jgi:preprotein translocase subunit SecY
LGSSTWYIFERYGGATLKSNPFNGTEDNSFCEELSVKFDQREKIGFWYIIFAIHCVLQALFMISDWNRDIFASHAGSKSGCLFNVFFASWLETLTLALMGVVLYFSTSSLWYVITLLLVLLVSRETFQVQITAIFFAYYS